MDDPVLGLDVGDDHFCPVLLKKRGDNPGNNPDSLLWSVRFLQLLVT